MSLLATWFKKKRPVQPIPEKRLRILSLAIPLGDRLLLEQFGKTHGWEVRSTNAPQDGFALASKKHFEVILCDRNQFGHPWREVMGRLSAISPRSCILLVSPVSNDYLWRDVLELGGYNVLVRPLREPVVFRTITAAAVKK